MKAQGEKIETRFLNILRELEKLNDIGLNHTSKFQDTCRDKKKMLKQELNQLIIQLRKTGCSNPTLKRYI
ncbi:MAG: hypothetical protein EP326_04995 [Deltaproteobacteria bacterium]|nr:MAG: hypothetical protein EP326_04995 [Deltaproteobacteria bacterium]TNF24582.1 MAG: hypothetical protein EP319_18025 [Deltaproteobacteria bacterium]